MASFCGADVVSVETLADSVIQRAIDYRAYRGGNTIKKYINCQKYFGKLSEKWKPTVDQFYSIAQTVLRLKTSGWDPDGIVGKVEICWYVAFKGMK